MSSLLQSLRILFAKMQPAINSEIFSQFAKAFPKSVAKGYSLCSDIQEAICPQYFTVCEKCFSVYDIDVKNPHFQHCIHQKTPVHSQLSRRLACGHNLFLEIKPNVFQPFCTFTYISILFSLQIILSRPGMIELCLEWKKHDNTSLDLLCDIL